MICKKCGRRINSNQELCEDCLSQEEVDAVKALFKASDTQDFVQDSSKKKSKKPWIILLCVLCPPFLIFYAIYKIAPFINSERASTLQNQYSSEDSLSKTEKNASSIWGGEEIEPEIIVGGGDGNYYRSGGIFCDWGGNYVKWGTYFTDARGDLIQWGQPFHDSKDNYCTWGSPFYDAKGNYIVPK